MADYETDLMLRVKAGDPAALEELYRLYERPLFSYLYRLSGNRTRAEDLLQETFLRVWRSAARYTPSAKVSTYLFHIAHNLFANEAARLRPASLPAPPDPETRSDPAADLERRNTHSAVLQALRTLPEGERACLLLSEYQGLSYSEIAEILDIPVGTVKSRIFNALRRLRDILSPPANAP
ncbi:MAG: RNA polymerase sigma factor [Planctomycetota bacterium]